MQDVTSPNENIQDIDISAEMQSSFLEYAYSVIYSRALPDARDGLKPVQRRILYQMNEMGLKPDKGHVKSARVVGEVMGKLHPHGDASIYDALVRLAQDFTLRVSLIDGHGNFGSLDDGPAAARYTEARLAPAALAMTEGLDEEVVDFVPNYDNQLVQPEVLPSAIPNLLVNGASGIAVGMATNLAPHNLIEVLDAARHLVEHPDATVDDLMQFVPGPDLPGGGIIYGLDGVREAYESGKGAFRTRARVAVEQLSARKSGLVVTELPYMVGPERVIQKIKQGIDAKKLSGISDVLDLSDRKNGLRLVISIKTGFNPEAVLEQLFRHTPLEESFSMNNVALVEGQPQTMNLKQMLEVFVAHRLSVVRRRSEFRLAKRKSRLHLVDGLLIAILDIDEVIQLIRTSDDAEGARQRLMGVFDLSELQADYILELRLRRLTKFSRVELEAERDTLRAEIEELETILASEARLRSVVTEEFSSVAAMHGTPRRTVLMSDAIEPVRATGRNEPQLEVADEPCRVLLSTTGLALRTECADTELAKTGSQKRHGALAAAVDTTTRSEVLAILTNGSAVRFTPADLPQVPVASIAFSGGVSFSAYLGIQKGGPGIVGLAEISESSPLALFTSQGVIKRVALNELPNKPEFELIALKAGDSLVSAALAPDDSQLVFVTTDAQLLHFGASNVRPQGRQAGGMTGIKLSPEAHVKSGFVISAKEKDLALVVTVAQGSEVLPGTESCSAKITELSEFPAKGRATGGVRAQRLLKGEDHLGCAWVGAGSPQALQLDGKPVSLPETLSKRDGSGTPLDGVVGSIGASIT